MPCCLPRWVPQMGTTHQPHRHATAFSINNSKHTAQKTKGKHACFKKPLPMPQRARIINTDAPRGRQAPHALPSLTNATTDPSHNWHSCQQSRAHNQSLRPLCCCITRLSFSSHCKEYNLCRPFGSKRSQGQPTPPASALVPALAAAHQSDREHSAGAEK